MSDDIKIDYDEENELFNFHIPGQDKVTGLGKSEVKKIIKEVFPDELRDDLGNAFKELDDKVVKEVVGKVVLPVLSDVLRPLEKVVFTTGANVLEKAYHEVNAALAYTYHRPVELINLAKTYAYQSAKPKESSWAKWLGEMDEPGWPKDPDVNKTEYNYWNTQLEQWDGWRPFVMALHWYKDSGHYTKEALVEAFNSISFYVANAGNVSIGLYFQKVYDRAPEVIATLRKYENGLPLNRKNILSFVDAIGPDVVDITLSAKIELGISIGGSVGAWSVPRILFDVMLDEVLKEAGVPA